ncbi:hypothetical protein GR925_03085 [Streptomyces sp. HUCO-GS316]|uniref:hypothetical protein n=1 Tax=Streptomyces sp. HUCO-GS316 TaxID=2692198 RepID=UPI00136AD3F7|nr:hypothetical protein [Streptomyces sp. HUCO-GS316]MXM62459.1 hypothetical protein [Streptomyces sp. HUCO-GS316]
MKRRPLPTAAALIATAALLLTACGSEDKKPDDEIAGAGSDGSTASATASPSTSKDSNRPDLSLPGDVQEVFEGWKTGDEAKDAVIADAGRSMTAVNRAITGGDVNSPALAYYYKGKALAGSAKWVQTFVDHDATITGTTRYYSPTVSLSGKSKAAVTLCADESKAFNRFRKTKKVDRSAPSDDSYVYYVSRLEQNSKGVWVTSEVVSKRGSQKCLP